MPTKQFIYDLHLLNDADMARKYGVHRKTIYNRRKEYGVPNPNGVTKRDLPVFNNLPDIEGSDPKQIWTLAEELRKKILEDEYRIEECEVSLIDDGPVLLIWLADWHIGHIGTNMEELEHDLELIARTPNVYVAFGGDYTENTNTAKSLRGTYHEQLLPIRVQKKLSKYAASIVQDKILVVLKGNHDAWSEQSDDFDFPEYLAKELEVPYLGDWGFINMRLGEQKYRGLMAHKGRGGGKDPLAPIKNLIDAMGDADFGFSAHKHISSVGELIIRERPVVVASAGAYLESGRFGRSIPVTSSVLDMPGVILFPDRHKVVGLRSALDDLWILEGARVFG